MQAIIRRVYTKNPQIGPIAILCLLAGMNTILLSYTYMKNMHNRKAKVPYLIANKQIAISNREEERTPIKNGKLQSNTSFMNYSDKLVLDEFCSDCDREIKNELQNQEESLSSSSTNTSTIVYSSNTDSYLEHMCNQCIGNSASSVNEEDSSTEYLTASTNSLTNEVNRLEETENSYNGNTQKACNNSRTLNTNQA